MRPLISRYFPAFLSQPGRYARGYVNTGSGATGRRAGGPSALESGTGNGRGMPSGGSEAVDDPLASPSGSEVELAQTRSGAIRSNPFEVHVVHELSVGVERRRANSAAFGVKGYVLPAAPKSVRSKGSRGRM
ncbi:hypothetical protein B0I37DRAFT_418335 [Chaetomium sp. MPI-CAGE-AT-0009]|nr:hypothetical protein B0I37DRAFT_418335 [Chaetomium sp. MPI-CAGE-AT-0009]